MSVCPTVTGVRRCREDNSAQFDRSSHWQLLRVAYSPLGRGFLTGTVKPGGTYEGNDIRNTDPRWQPGNYEKNLAAVEQLRALAESKRATLSQLALAWLLAQRDYVVPIPGTRNPKRVEENAAAADLQLTADDLEQIRRILPTGGFGARYTPQHPPRLEPTHPGDFPRPSEDERTT